MAGGGIVQHSHSLTVCVVVVRAAQHTRGAYGPDTIGLVWLIWGRDGREAGECTTIQDEQ